MSNLNLKLTRTEALELIGALYLPTRGAVRNSLHDVAGRLKDAFIDPPQDLEPVGNVATHGFTLPGFSMYPVTGRMQASYLVVHDHDQDVWTCTCPDFRHRKSGVEGDVCKHIRLLQKY